MLEDFNKVGLEFALHWMGLEPHHLKKMLEAAEGQTVMKDFQFKP